MSVALFLGFLSGPDFFDGGADVGFPGERFVLGWVVGREVGDGDVHLLEQFGGLGEFVAVHIRLAVGPSPFVGGQRVSLHLRGVAEGEPELGEESMRGLSQLAQSLGLALRLGELAEVMLGQGESGGGRRERTELLHFSLFFFFAGFPVAPKWSIAMSISSNTCFMANLKCHRSNQCSAYRIESGSLSA